MIVNNDDYKNGFNERNQVKDLGAYILNLLEAGTNCSRFESKIISEEIKSKISLFVPDDNFCQFKTPKAQFSWDK